MFQIIKLVLIGVASGLLGGMGMGGGTVLIPLLTMFADINQKTAQAMNLISFIPMAIVALILHAKNGLIRKKGLFFVVIPACITAVAGSFLCSLVKTQILTKCFGGFLIALSGLQFFADKLTATKEKTNDKM